MKRLALPLMLLAATRLLAVTPVPFTESVSFSFKLSGTGTSSMNLYDEAGSQYLLATASGSTIESALGTASLRPGKTYSLEFWGDGPSGYLMSFIAPSGYSVYVNGVPTDLVGQSPGGGWFLHYYTVEIRPAGATGGSGWGAFSGIQQGKSITWEVGLGDLRTGRGAGTILFKELDLANSPASRARLYYAAPPANVGQIVIIKDGASNQTLRQIVTPIGFTDLVDVTGGYEIRCYLWGQVASWNGTLYTFTGSPWKTIKVESPANNQLKITETEGNSSPVVRVSNLTGTGSTNNTGGTISYVGSDSLHTFTSGGTLTVNSALTGASWLVVGGGGGGGSHNNAGGGGGGSVEYLTGQTLAATSYTVVVGTGGAADTNGSNSTFNGTTGYGGGHGGSASAGSAPTTGGSGGGGWTNGGGANAGSGSNVRAGGGGDNGGSAWQGGGGGGANSAQNQSQGGGTYNGGNGLANSITGTAAYYAGGGGGGTSGGMAMTGGLGGGGAGGSSGSASGVAGSANTGGGGGGSATATAGTGGAGGSGVVIVRYATPTMTWTLQEGDSTDCARTTVHTITSSASGQRDDVAAVYTTTGTYASPTNTLISKTKYHYVNQAWGEELDSVIADPDASNPAERTTTYAYHTNSSNKGSYRLLKSVTAPTGAWTAWEYYDDWDRRGRVKYQFQPWLDSPSAASSASATTGRVVFSEYTTDWTGRYTRPTLREERINNTLVGQTTWSHGDVTGSGEPRAYASINSYRDGTNSHTDYVETYRADADPDFAGQLYQSKGANLAQTSGSVSRGTFNPSTKAFTVGSSGDHWRELKFNGSTSSTGADSVTSFNSQSCPAVYLIPNKSTLDVTIRIAQGYVYRTETYVYTGSGNFSLMTSEDFDYDAYGHLTQRSASNGALTNYSYPNGRLTSTTDPAGTETQFTYDAIGRVATSVKKGAAAFGSYAAQGDITTTPTYDGANNVTRTVVSGGALSQTAATPFDLAGRLTSSTAPGGYTTAFAYSSGGKVITATLPGGATRITETYLDGQAKSLTGTAVVAEYYSYSVNSTTGTITRQVNFGTSASTALVKTTTDWLGRKIKEERPTFSGSGTFTLTFTYNSLGQLVARSETGLSDALYSYDTLGTLTREGLDIGGNGTLDLASSDRITDHAWTFFTASSAWWKRDTTTTYATASSSTSTQLGKVETQLSGLPTNRLTRTDSTDIFGNVTSQFVDVNRSGKLVTTTTDAPDSTTDTQQIAYNGLVVSSRDTANLTTTFGHDALGRPVTSVDPRTGTTTTAYVSGTSQVSTVTDPASIVQATYTYDSAGRVSSVKDALNKYAYTSYTTRGEVYRQWGDTTYPVENGYDTWGRRTTMKTYRAGSGWTGSTWPTGTTGTADTTTWAYQESTGLLSSKTDAANKAVTYTYTARGQIDVRTWARGVTTDYGYSATTGELTSVNYSDSTPDLAYTYNRLGSSANVTDYTGTRTLNYNLAGTLEMQSEDLPAFFGSRRITWPHATSGIIGRPTGLQLGTSGSPTSEQNVTWGYDPYGRFNSLAGGGTTLAYTYATNSNLLASIADTASGWTQTRSYVTNRDLLDIIETKISTTSKAKFDYAHDNLGRRTSVNKTGDLYSRYGNGSQGLDTAWGYDDRSQVTSEQTKLGGSATVLTGRDDAYAFDNIGNRATATHNSQLTTYTSTLLNTYSQRTVPGVFDVAGAAGSGTTVTVNGSSSGVTRHGEYFFNGQSMSNGSGAVFSTLAVSDGTTATNLGAFLAGTPEAFSYDDDGNLLSDGRWDYVYDAENRLVSMQTHTALSPTPLANADARRIEFKSDYLGRRVQKTVRDGWNGSTFATVVSDEKFVYDGWNCIAKLNASSLSLIASYFWGLDWSGTLQGAGGVGGLALTVEGGNTYLPMFDGNGNVMGMIKASDGSLAAAYEYDAFGNTLRESGPYAASNPFRFSTKYTDLETGLVYYGLRYYSPSLGRFLNKDPISERGGLNLYAFCENDGVNHWDYLGMNPPFRGFAPVSPVDPNIMRIGAANNAIYQYNTFIAAPATAVITAPVTRTVVGGGRAISGVINMVAGANVAGAGTAATVTIPVIGQVSGPAAVTLGSAQMTYGYYGFMSGMIDVSKGLSGQGYSPIQSLQPIAPIPTSSTTSGSFTGSVEPGILKLETFVVTVTKGVTDKNPKPDTPKPGSKGNAGTGSGNTSRQSRTTPGATVITDPDAIADILGSLGSAADAAIKAEVQRIQSENMQ